jgi:all-trans-retinol dehydrogenase (NAD+)
MARIAGKRVLVTGGASGMGRRVALECARRGADVVLWDIDGQRLAAVKAEVEAAGGSARADVCSVADREAVYRTARAVESERGSVDVVVNCAGVVSGAPMLELKDEQIERTFAVNTLALYWTTKAFLPRMIEHNSGHIVTLASASGMIGVAKLVDYAASKWAAMGFDESLRVELKKSAPGVKTTVVCPYYVNTGMFAGVKSRFPLLLPILEEADVSRRIVAAIEHERPRLVMPWLVFLLPLMRVLPVPLMDALANFLGVNVSMDEFVGRGHSSESPRAAVAGRHGA